MRVKKLANVILIGAGFVFGVALIFFIYAFALTQQREFASWHSGLLHYVILSALVGICFGALWLHPSRRTRIAASLIVFVVASLTAEIVIEGVTALEGKPLWGIEANFPDYRREVAELAGQSGLAADLRSRSELVADLQRRQIDAVPAVMIGAVLAQYEQSPAGARIDASRLIPMAGVSHRTTVLCNESGQPVTFESDLHGFRNPDSAWQGPGADIVAVGESFVQGYCVPDGESFVDRLRARYSRVLSLGASGDSALLQLGALKEYARPYAPRVVLWVFCEGIDQLDLIAETRHPLLNRYLEPDFSQHLMERQSEIDAMLVRGIAPTAEGTPATPEPRSSPLRRAAERAKTVIKLAQLRDQLGLIYGEKGHDELVWNQAKRLQLLNVILGQANALTSSWGGTLYFVYLPGWQSYAGIAGAFASERAATLRSVSQLGIPVIDVAPAFRATGDPLSLFPLRKVGHYTSVGNRIVAETVLNAIASRRSAN